MSDAELTDRTEEIFTRAVALPAAERPAFLDRSCGNETSLRERVEKLLAADARLDGFLEDPTFNPAKQRNAGAIEAQGFAGAYKLLEKIGQGGFGEVYEAEQRSPLMRRVAIKVIKLGMDTRQVIARFEAERQALALMDHPNIAKVFDAGATSTGRPYFVMELVRGTPITQFCEGEHLPLEKRLELFCQVCHAVQHAHQKGIIHRDLKPSNVLVSFSGKHPLPRVIDFGIAKATQGRLTDGALCTQAHELVGTPAYMSPEQAQLDATDVDTRTDVYSLGVLLYELLTGSTPFDSKELLQSDLEALRRVIRSREPLRPSARLRQMANASSRPRSRLPWTRVASDLDWIAMKAIEKDRSRRYESATALAADIERFLNQEPVSAVAPSALYTFGKLCRRNKVVVVASVLIAVSVVLGLAVAMTALVREKAERAKLERLQYASDMELALTAIESADPDSAFLLLERHTPSDDEPDLRGWEWYYVDQFRHQEVASCSLRSCITEVNIPDNRSVVVAVQAGDQDCTMRFLDATTLREVNAIWLPRASWVAGMTFLPHDGKIAVNTSLVTLQNGKVEGLLSPELPQRCWPPAISANGKWFVGSYEPDGGRRPATFAGQPHRCILRCVDLESPRQRFVGSAEFTAPDNRMPDHERRISPDSGRVAVACVDRTVRVFTLPDLTQESELRVTGSPTCVAWSGDSLTLAVSCEFPELVEVFDLRTNSSEPKHTLDYGVQKSPAFDLRISRDGLLMALSTYENLIILWDLGHDPPLERAVFRGHRTLPTSLAFSPDGTKLVSGDDAGSLRVWDTAEKPPSPLGELPDEVIGRLEYSPGGDRIAMLSRDGVIRLFDVETGKWVSFTSDRAFSTRATGARNDMYPPLCFSSDGRFLVAGNGGPTVAIYDVSSGRELRELHGHTDTVFDISVTPDCESVITVSGDGTVKSWAMADGALQVDDFNPPKSEAIFAVACSADGKFVAIGGKRMELTIRDAKTLAVLASLPAQALRSYRHSITSLRFSPDGTRLACGLRNEMLLLEVPSLSEIGRFGGLSGDVLSIDFSPDGRTLVGVSECGMSSMVNLNVMHGVGDVAGRRGPLAAVRFSPDGRTLAVSGPGTGIRLFRLPTQKD